MALCLVSDRLGLSLARQAARLSAVGGPGVAQALSSYVGDLPPLGPAGGGSTLTRGIVEAFGGIYYYGELEEASLMALAELVVEERYTLSINDRSLFQALEDMATLMHRGWYDQSRRQTLFSQMLGFGATDGLRSRLRSVVDALLRLEQSGRFGPPSGSELVAVELAFAAMLNAIASRGGLGLERAAQVLNGQLRAALAVLGNAALHRMFRVHDMWGLVRALAVSPTGRQPDTTAIVDRAQAGAAIIGWAAGRVREISARDGSLRAALMNDATLLREATRWAMGARALQEPSSPSERAWADPQPGGLRGTDRPRGDGYTGGWA